jgi:hypothetical protein
MQSISTSPFAFYVQAEVSEHQSCPFWAIYPCTSFDLESGTEHLRMFNTRYIVARSDKLKDALSQHPEWDLAYSRVPYEVWELTTNPNAYVTVPKYHPTLFVTSDWKNISYQWFRNISLLDKPLVFKAGTDEIDNRLFSNIVESPSMESLTLLDPEPVGRECNIQEIVDADEIEFSTDCIGQPHIISISFYPSWKVEGASRIYLVSPSFMLVYPERERVRISYEKEYIDWLGIALSAAATMLIGYTYLSRDQKFKDFFAA